MEDLASEFITETAEGLNALDVELVTLEQNPNDSAILGEISRAFRPRWMAHAVCITRSRSNLKYKPPDLPKRPRSAGGRRPIAPLPIRSWQACGECPIRSSAHSRC